MYKILESDNKEELEKLVNEHRKNGYNLVGGVSCSLCESDEYFYITYVQAVEKEEVYAWDDHICHIMNRIKECSA